ncbi:MAG: class F sortase [Pseudonocardiaceae bacterium]
MPTRNGQRGGRGRFAAAIAAVPAAALLVACSAVQNAPSSSTAAPGPSAAVSTAAPQPILADSLPESVPLAAQIPAIGVATGELVHLGLTADRALEVPDDAVTAGWFNLSPTPGEIGPSVVAGHVNYASVPGVFARLHEMQPGDVITIDRADGTSAVFTAYDVEQYSKAAFPTERVYGDTDRPELRLITCGGSFDEAAGEYRDNVVVFAGLTSAYQR